MTISASVTPELVSAMLAKDGELIAQLEQILLSEREALEKRDHTALPPLIEDKNQVMGALAEHALQRQSWLEAAKLSLDHQGWQQWLAKRPETRKQTDAWQTLADQFEACRELNEINGKIIHRAQQTLGQLLDLLRGKNNDGPSLYNAQGRPGPQSGSQTLVKV